MSRFARIVFGLLIALFCVSLPHTASAFDGTRKGFVMGIGISYAPVVRWNYDQGLISTSAGGGGLTGVIGYALDGHNVLTYQGMVAGRDMAELDQPDGSVLVHFYEGLCYYRYFGPQGKAPYLSGGIGMVSYHTDFSDIEGSGFGYTAGLGFEFSKQVQFGLQYFGGSTSGHGHDARMDVLQLSFTVIAY